MLVRLVLVSDTNIAALRKQYAITQSNEGEQQHQQHNEANISVQSSPKMDADFVGCNPYHVILVTKLIFFS